MRKLPPDERASAFDRAVGRLLSPSLTILAVAGALLAVANAVFPAPESPSWLILLAGGASGTFLAARLALARWDVPMHRAHFLAVLAGILALFVVLLQLQATGEPRDTGLLLLLLLGAGLLLLEWAWFALLSGMALAGWVLVAGTRLPEPEWAFFGLLAVMTVLLAGVLLRVRSLGAEALVRHGREGRIRQLELETALAQTERARQGEESARKALETALTQVKESEERFRRLADASFEGVIISRDGRILDANARAAEMFTVAAPQLLGDPVLNLIADPDREFAERTLLRGGARPGRGAIEVEGRRYDGSRFPMELSVVDSVLLGRPARVLVIRDVTAQKRAEGILRRALEEAEANSMAKNTFLANMSHELRTPLNSVIGFANLLVRRLDERVEEREMDFLRRIVTNGEHLLSLIEDILDLSKIDAQKLEVEIEEVAVEELLRETAKSLEFQARRKGLALEIEPCATPSQLWIKADRRRLRQVLINLTGNAIKFTQEGHVRLRITCGKDGVPERIEVEDTGIGIPREQFETVFLPFQQGDPSYARAFGGSGLGLTISRSLCHLMGFELSVRSGLGTGSTFVIHLQPGRPESGVAAPAGGDKEVRA